VPGIKGISMAYEIRVEQAEPRTIASVRRRSSGDQLATVVPAACGYVWTFIKAAGIANPGRHIAVYREGKADRIDVEIGVEIPAPFTGDGDVSCSATPDGPAATTVHVGPYDRLGEAHDAILRWCRDHHRNLAGPNWEIYGHWDDDPSKVQTEVFYLLSD
jgi:effector-binding domain-containing protein